MKPLAELTDAAARGVAFVLTDIDDTITTDGRLPAASSTALERLHEAALKVIPVTGRPGGWCDLIARFWPISGVVGENGAFYFRYDHAAKRMTRRFRAAEAERAENREKLDALAEEILARVPGAALAADQPYRVADLAIDFCEDVPALPETEVDRIVSIFEKAGAQAKVSSIHVNGWFGAHDKTTGARWIVRRLYGRDLDAERGRWVYVGDSTNDQAMFACFPLSVGVANLLRFAAQLHTWPAYLAEGERGAGFAQVAQALLAARRALP
jgi:HAD superfamily hydrolase (TIGR01484 family)